MIIKTGIIKAYYKVKITQNFFDFAHTINEEDFIKKLEILQKYNINDKVCWKFIMDKDFCFKELQYENYNINSITNPLSNIKSEKNKENKNIENKKILNNSHDNDFNINNHLIGNNSKLNLIKNIKNIEKKKSVNIDSGENIKKDKDYYSESKSNYDEKDQSLNNIYNINQELLNTSNNNEIYLKNKNSFSEENKIDKESQDQNSYYNFSPKSYMNKSNLINIMEDILEENLNENSTCNNNNISKIDLDEQLLLENEVNFGSDKGLNEYEERIKDRNEKKNEISKIDLYENDTLCFSTNKKKNISRDSVYNVLIEIMEFTDKDMVCEYYASICKKIDLYLLPVLPTEVVLIKTEDFKNICPELSFAIKEYSCPVFETKRSFKKLYRTLKWKREKKDLLGSVIKR